MSWTTVGVQSNNRTSMNWLTPEITTNKTLLKFHIFIHTPVHEFSLLFYCPYLISFLLFLQIHRSETFCSAQMLKMENLRCARNIFMVDRIKYCRKSNSIGNAWHRIEWRIETELNRSVAQNVCNGINNEW